MTGCERILARLEQGPATAAELYALGVMVHSRVADLRKRGHVITCEHIAGKTGTAGFEYRLLDRGRGAAAAASSVEQPSPPQAARSTAPVWPSHGPAASPLTPGGPELDGIGAGAVQTTIYEALGEVA